MLSVKILIVYFLVTTLFVSSCSNQTNVESKKSTCNEVNIHDDAIALNSQALKLLEKAQRLGRGDKVRDSLLLETLYILEKAIKQDTSFLPAYLNKSTVLKELSMYEEAISALDQLFAVNPNYPEALFMKGLLYEKTGNLDSAHIFYMKALRAYEEFLKTPSATTNDEINLMYVKLFVFGKEKTLTEIDKKLKQDINDEEHDDLLIFKKVIRDFDRVNFMKEF